jgi:bifunctional enzyme CysN/CysC
VREVLPDSLTAVREKVHSRNSKWEKSAIEPERRAERASQRPTLLLFTGAGDGERRRRLARALEMRLFEAGRHVYYFGMANVVYGVDADLEGGPTNRTEHLRRLAEISHLMLEAGLLLIVSIAELGPSDLELLATSIPPDRIEVVWVGDGVPDDLKVSLVCGLEEDVDEAVRRAHDRLQTKGIVYRAW